MNKTVSFEELMTMDTKKLGKMISKVNREEVCTDIETLSKFYTDLKLKGYIDLSYFLTVLEILEAGMCTDSVDSQYTRNKGLKHYNIVVWCLNRFKSRGYTVESLLDVVFREIFLRTSMGVFSESCYLKDESYDIDYIEVIDGYLCMIANNKLYRIKVGLVKISPVLNHGFIAENEYGIYFLVLGATSFIVHGSDILMGRLEHIEKLDDSELLIGDVPMSLKKRLLLNPDNSLNSL